MALQINFVRDVAAHCVERLVESGYTPTPADDKDAIRTYVSIRHRRVRPLNHPRPIFRPSDVLTNGRLASRYASPGQRTSCSIHVPLGSVLFVRKVPMRNWW